RTGATSSAVISKEGSGRKMKHPDQATLALHAGGDLNWFARRRMVRHLAQCDRCRDEVDAFAATREIFTDLGEIPEVPWNRLVTGLMMERPAPHPVVIADDTLVVQATTVGNGIQIRRGGAALRLMNPDSLGPQQRVLYSPGAQGSIRARYVDPETGNVTVNNV